MKRSDANYFIGAIAITVVSITIIISNNNAVAKCAMVLGLLAGTAITVYDKD